MRYKQSNKKLTDGHRGAVRLEKTGETHTGLGGTNLARDIDTEFEYRTRNLGLRLHCFSHKLLTKMDKGQNPEEEAKKRID
jgi:hypothetical protein